MPKFEWKWPWEKAKPDPAPIRAPKVGGTRAPLNVEKIDFEKPHDFHFRFGYQPVESHVFRNCRLVGFTTPMNDDSATPQWEERTHNRWIVLQREDGRRVYVPRDSLVFIEDSAPAESSPPV